MCRRELQIGSRNERVKNALVINLLTEEGWMGNCFLKNMMYGPRTNIRLFLVLLVILHTIIMFSYRDFAIMFF